MEANLSGALLYKADPSKAIIIEAYMKRTGLSGANLSAANLNYADLSNAIPNEADRYPVHPCSRRMAKSSWLFKIATNTSPFTDIMAFILTAGPVQTKLYPIQTTLLTGIVTPMFETIQ